MTAFALIGSLSALAIGFASVLGEGGYSFDLRRKNRRKDSNRVGGRRFDDAVTA